MGDRSRFYDDSKDGIADAQQHFLKAIALDFRYARAHASAALCVEARLRNGWIHDVGPQIEGEIEREIKQEGALACDRPLRKQAPDVPPAKSLRRRHQDLPGRREVAAPGAAVEVKEFRGDGPS